MRIAYVEDDTDARTIFLRKFLAEGIACDAFGAGEELLQAASPGIYDLLLIDIRLPGYDGVELLKRLRQRNIFTPVIIITAFNTLEYAHNALNSGANYLLEKPFSFNALLRCVYNVVSRPQSLQDCIDRGLSALNLAKREEETARLLLKGFSNKEIGRLVSISEKTVKQYVSQIFDKAHVNSRGEFFSFIFPV